MHERRRLKQKPEPVEFIGRVASKGANKASQFRLSFFLKDRFRGQAEDKLASVIGAKANPVTVSERSRPGRFAVHEDPIALTAILDKESGGARGNSHALA